MQLTVTIILLWDSDSELWPHHPDPVQAASTFPSPQHTKQHTYSLAPWESSISSPPPPSNPHQAAQKAPTASRDPTSWSSRAKHHCHLLQESFGKLPPLQMTYPIQGLVPVSLTGTLYPASQGSCAESYLLSLDWEGLEDKVLARVSLGCAQYITELTHSVLHVFAHGSPSSWNSCSPPSDAPPFTAHFCSQLL